MRRNTPHQTAIEQLARIFNFAAVGDLLTTEEGQERFGYMLDGMMVAIFGTDEVQSHRLLDDLMEKLHIVPDSEQDKVTCGFISESLHRVTPITDQMELIAKDHAAFLEQLGGLMGGNNA